MVFKAKWFPNRQYILKHSESGEIKESHDYNMSIYVLYFPRILFCSCANLKRAETNSSTELIPNYHILIMYNLLRSLKSN